MSLLRDVFQCDAPVALVTGSGAPRVGREIAVALAAAGCRIALHAKTHGDEAEEAAKDIAQRYSVETMVTLGALDQDEVAGRLVDETVAKFGRLDILVNSAAIWSPEPLESVTPEEMREYFQVNAVAPFLCAKAAGLQMVRQESGGAIVNLGDWATVRPYLDHAAYFPSKGAIETMTRSLAVELGSRNHRVRVNCVQPGPVLFGDDVDEPIRQKIAGSTLTGDVGTPRHVAHAVRFLCENDFVNGICLPVDGGRTIYAPDGLQVGLNSG